MFKFMEIASRTFKELYSNNSWWVANAVKKQSNLLIDLDRICEFAERDEKNLSVLLQKTFQFYNDPPNIKWRELNDSQLEKWNQLFAFFSELKTFEEMVERKFNNIKFLSTQREKQPDFKAVKNGEIYFIEVKRKRISKTQQISEKLGGLYSSDGQNNEALKKGVHDFVTDALKKFETVGVEDKNKRVLLIDYEPGDGTEFLADGSTLAHVLGVNFFNSLRQKYMITVWTSNYFSKYNHPI